MSRHAATAAAEAALLSRLLFSIAEAARLLSLGRSTVYEIVARGELRAVRVGGKFRIRASDLHDFVAGLPLHDPGETLPEGKRAPLRAVASVDEGTP